MNKILAFLKGKKTFIVVALGAIVIVLGKTGVLDEQVVTDILVLLGLGGLATLRLALLNK